MPEHPKSVRGRVNHARAVRQEALREQLAGQQHIRHVVDLIEKVKNDDKEWDAVDVQRVKVAIDGHLALIKKYCPDLKAVEHSGIDGESLVIEVINYAKKDQTPT